MTNGELCTNAIRATGARSLGSAPSAAEMALAMQTLESMLLSVLVIGRTLTDVLITESYQAGEDERIYDDTDDQIAVTLPGNITDPDANEDRAPRNGAVVKINGSYRATYVYVAYLGTWSKISDLVQGDEQPLGEEFDESLTAMLAVRLASPLRGKVDDVTVGLASQGRRIIRLQFRQVIPATIDPVLVGYSNRVLS